MTFAQIDQKTYYNYDIWQSKSMVGWREEKTIICEENGATKLLLHILKYIFIFS